MPSSDKMKAEIISAKLLFLAKDAGFEYEGIEEVRRNTRRGYGKSLRRPPEPIKAINARTLKPTEKGARPLPPCTSSFTSSAYTERVFLATGCRKTDGMAFVIEFYAVAVRVFKRE